MNVFTFSNLAKGSVLLVSAALLTACGGASSTNNNEDGKTPSGSSVNLPDGKNLVLIDASSTKHYLYNTTTEKSLDLNDEASKSGDQSVQNLAVSDPSTIGSFFLWADDANGDGTINDEKVVLMKPNYQAGTAIDHTNMQYLAHFHGEEFAAHAASEFNPATYGDNWAGSKKEKGLARLNAYVTKQKELFDEVDEALKTAAAGQILCRAFVDPRAGAEHEGEEHNHGVTPRAEAGHEAHAEKPAVHIALTNSGRMYFMAEKDGAMALTQDTFVALTGVSGIENCAKTGITRASDNGVLVFVEDSQKIYLVDNHGADWHEHSNWDISKLMPAGFHADYVAALGAGEGAHDEHDDGHDEHDHE